MAEHRRIEEQLQWREQQYRCLFANNLDAVFSVDTAGRFVEANPAAERLSGYTEAELRQVTFMELCAPDRLAATVACFQRSMAGHPEPIETALVRKDGRRVEVHVSGCPIIVDGRVVGEFNIARDITERKTREAALRRDGAEVHDLLRRSEERNRAMLSAVPDLMFQVTADGRFVHYLAKDPADLAMTPREFLGRPLDQVLPPEVAGPALECVRRCLRAGSIEVLEYSMPVRGQNRHYEARFAAVPPDEVLVIVRNVSERFEAQRRMSWLMEKLLIAQEEERRRIARELHDGTGQALTSLLVGLRTMEDVATLADAQVQARQLRHFVTQTLDDVRRLASGLRPAVLDDLGLFAALDRFVRDFASSRCFHVELEIDPQDLAGLSPPVETAIYRIVQEAFANMTRHARASSARIVANRQPDALDIIIEDNGRGFDPQAVLNASSHQGLGLHSMRERATLLGGSLEIDSVPTRGTTLLLRLPLKT